MKNKCLIISCYACTGMNYAINKLKSKYKIKIIDKYSDFYKKYPTPEIYQNYILSESKTCDILFIPYFNHMEQRYLKGKIDYYLIYPNIKLKNEYIKRFKDDNFTKEQISNLVDNWDEMIHDCMNYKKSIELQSGEYAYDKILDLINASNKELLTENFESLITRPREFFKKIQLWRVSLFKEDKVGQHSFNPGTKLSNPRMSSFWICGDAAEFCDLYGFRLAITQLGDEVLHIPFNTDDYSDYVKELKQKCRIDIPNGEGFYINAELFPEDYVRKHLPTVYRYGVKVHGYETGIGWHNKGEYTLDKDIIPDTVEELDYDYFKKHLKIVFLDKDAYEKEYLAKQERIRKKDLENPNRKKWGEGLGFPYLETRDDAAKRFTVYFNKILKSASNEKDPEIREKLMQDIAEKYKLIMGYKMKMIKTNSNDLHIPDEYKDLFTLQEEYDFIEEYFNSLDDFNIALLEGNEYKQYVKGHIRNLKTGYRWLKRYMPELFPKGFFNKDRMKINHAIRIHDRSKWGASEYKQYKAYNDYRNGNKPKEGPEYEKIKANYDAAWNHHQKSNPHHWQYWILTKYDGTNTVLDMPYENIIEMICDWWTFSWKSNDLYAIFDWYNQNRNKMILSAKTRSTVENILAKMRNRIKELEKKEQLKESIQLAEEE